ncbi:MULTISPECIES: 4-hydroxy-2-oxoheptanedioate aldolase [unclassified Rhizobium]|uniref:4-hydroxy-2-oxoheptanedioate aldolase n=1 Tax=unclassified Rhizobium TaxID=2613769 RepID=UPI001A992307|nr:MULTISPECIES: 4-hydroxy-2-oxoheptanedioate aldolase [unclassified Rhizobium]MBX5185533.1 4-hydroxy-2-oxoheptanedioate aldolase [Rhizobium sp. NZLR5]MBX5187324.1 4-hydroxy-2-oxoheptanedioate aldolase [Rhizobium sp. NZLR3b]MBX5200411.1 4-hydroxy-2-oxoheptanedioate aldolase [Rhizobium sp. NZLR1]QSZ23320.1 4-hydroxy-2-oxoheptanedioate aldolase [Rhizobium sp. NZLR1]
MPAPKNLFKQALKEGRAQIGLWQALANPYTVEISAGAGYDWLLLDAEHAPNDVPLLVSQLQAMKGAASHAVIRPPVGETWIIKQMLDIGAQTLLIPMVDSKEMAEAMVRAMRYPPQGVRGVGAALARASAFNRIPDYLQTANDEICLLLQVESRAGLAALDAIASTDGVDGVFIGPADLAADMGHLGKPGARAVQAEVEKALARIQSHGKAAGILIGDLSLAKRYLELGATFVAIGNDVTLLTNATTRLLDDFKKAEPSRPATDAKAY